MWSSLVLGPNYSYACVLPLTTKKILCSTDLLCMYKLFSRVCGGLMCVVRCMSTHLRETGRSIVTEDGAGGEAPGRNALSYIQNLLDLHDQYNMFLEKSFASDKLFKNAIQSVSQFYHQSLCMYEGELDPVHASFLSVCSGLSGTNY